MSREASCAEGGSTNRPETSHCRFHHAQAGVENGSLVVSLENRCRPRVLEDFCEDVLLAESGLEEIRKTCDFLLGAGGRFFASFASFELDEEVGVALQ